MRDHSKNEIILTAAQDNGLCSYCNNDYEDMHIYDVHDQLMFSIEFEDSIGYLSKQMVIYAAFEIYISFTIIFN